MDEFPEKSSEMDGSAFGDKDRSNPQATEAAGEDDDRHPRFPGRRRNGQCRKGHTPNPRGRPRKARSTRAIFQEMLQSKVPMMVGNKQKKVTVVEAMAARVKREALTGNLRALERGLAVARAYSISEPEPEGPPWDLSRLTDDELDVFESLLGKISIDEEPEPSPPEGDGAVHDNGGEE